MTKQDTEVRFTLRMPKRIFELIRKEADAVGNSAASVIKNILAKHYHLMAEKERS